MIIIKLNMYEEDNKSPFLLAPQSLFKPNSYSISTVLQLRHVLAELKEPLAFLEAINL